MHANDPIQTYDVETNDRIQSFNPLNRWSVWWSDPDASYLILLISGEQMIQFKDWLDATSRWYDLEIQSKDK